MNREAEILAEVLDGSPLAQPCDTIATSWCEQHCKWFVPSKECWLRYAEVLVEVERERHEQ